MRCRASWRPNWRSWGWFSLSCSTDCLGGILLKHHFGDSLDREHGYWTIVPNRERWRAHFGDLLDAPADAKCLTVTRNDRNWESIFDFGDLRELTLHEPSQCQLMALAKLPQLHSLRITHARPKSLDTLSGIESLKELVLEYVSGFDDLGPVGKLPNLQSLHIENLRRVRDFNGLALSRSLKYLSIDGTLDWKQPIHDLEFLASMESLEFLGLANVRIQAPYPVFSPLRSMRKLKIVKITQFAVELREFAFLQASRPDVEGAIRAPFIIHKAERRPVSGGDVRNRMPEADFRRLKASFIDDQGRRFIEEPTTAYLLGKGTRSVSGKDSMVQAKCDAHARLYESLIVDAKIST